MFRLPCRFIERRIGKQKAEYELTMIGFVSIVILVVKYMWDPKSIRVQLLWLKEARLVGRLREFQMSRKEASNTSSSR